MFVDLVIMQNNDNSDSLTKRVISKVFKKKKPQRVEGRKIYTCKTGWKNVTE